MLRPATLLIWFLALLPVLLAGINLLDLSWRSPSVALSVLGRLTGVGGLSFLLVAAILSSRVPGFDVRFGGLTKLWLTHHRLAAVSFLLLLAHPILLGLANSNGSPAQAVATLFANFEFTSANWDLWAGWLALLVMMVFLAPSFGFFGEPEYQRWKWLHRLAGVAIILALTHAVLLARAIPHPWDYLVWGFFAVLAITAVLYRFLFSRFAWGGVGGRFCYKVTEVVTVAGGVVEISLRAVSRQLNYRAGQFVYFTPRDQTLSVGAGEEHPYTISSAPQEKHLRVAIKDLGDASRSLQHIKVGSDVDIEGPYGAFFPNEYDDDSELWIAGGIGITPFLSRARFLRQHENEVDVCLIYCVQDEARVLFKDELLNISEQLPGFTLQMHYFYQQGPLTLQFIQQHCNNIKTRGVYICGPIPLLNLGRKISLSAGVPSKRITTEEFNLL